MVDILITPEELRCQERVSREIREYLTILEDRIVNLLVTGDNLGSTTQFFNRCMVKLESLHGDVDELKAEFGKIS